MVTCPGTTALPVPRSMAERWAVRVLKAAESDGDIKTLAEWARQVGVSYSSLCESCRLLGIQPHDARDFARMLRVQVQSGRHRCQPEALLDVSDRRTLNRLLERAGFERDPIRWLDSIDEFLQRQQFVVSSNQGLLALRRLLHGRCEPPAHERERSPRAPAGPEQASRPW